MKMTRMFVAGMLVIAALLPAGCFARSEQSADEGGVAIAPMPAETPQAGVTSEGYGVREELSANSDAVKSTTDSGTQRMVIKNGTVEIRVKDIDDALDALKNAVASHGAEIADLSVSGGGEVVPLDAGREPQGPTYATITIRVEATRLDALTAAIEKLGTVTSQTESASDVTEQAVDMEARLKNLRAEEDRLRSFLQRADKISDLLAVEAELSRVRGEIESMDAQLTYLKRQVAKATLTVSLSEPGSVVGPESPWFGIREAFSDGIQGALEVIQFLIALVIALLPLALFVGVIVWVIVALVRRRRRKRAAAQGLMVPGPAGQGPIQQASMPQGPATQETTETRE